MKLPRAYSPATMTAMSRPAHAAEMVPGVDPQWHVVEVFPGTERKVARALTARRFGIYIPESDEVVVVRGCSVKRTELLFPGYIFVFVWDVLKHRRRIEKIDGVIRVILDINGQPLQLSDNEIDRIRFCENSHRPIELPEYQIEVYARSSKKKKQRRRTKRVIITVSDEVVRTRAGGWVRGDFDDTVNENLISLDSQERNQTLLRALGLCSVAAPKGDVLADGGLE
jgi:transcription antitermination factor NusG